MEPRLLKVDEASRYINLHEETVYDLARKGVIPVVRVGRSIRFDRYALDLWIDKKIAESQTEALQSPWSYLNREGV